MEVRKIWRDGKNIDEIRPAYISVRLYADGETVETVKLSAANNWTYIWDKLDKYAAGKEIVYTVREIYIPDGYTVRYDTSVAGLVSITNVHEPENTPTPSPTPTATPTATPSVTPPPTTTPSTPPNVPTGYTPVYTDGEWIYLDEYGVPLGDFAGTGDNSNMMLWGIGGGVLMSSGIAIALILMLRRRKNS